MKSIITSERVGVAGLTLACMALLALGGCASGPGSESDASRALGDALDAAQQAQARYPSTRYIAAPGYSSVSAAAAEANARGAVADAIRSRLRSSLEAQTRETRHNDDFVHESDYRRTISAKAEFTYGELIKADATATRRVDDQYVAVAYLDRARATGLLSRDYEEVAMGFRSAARALPLVLDDVPAFAEKIRTVRSGYRQLADRDRELRAVSGGAHPAFQDDFARYREALELQRQVLAGVTVGLIVADAADFPGQQVEPQIAEALNRLGLAVTGRDCGRAHYVLQLEPLLSERRIIGSVFELAFDGVLTHCDSGRKIAVVHLAHPDFRGEGRAPLEQLRRRITPESVAAILDESLGHALPVWSER